MNAMRWTTTLALLALCAVPAAGQQPAGMSAHGARMHQGMIQPWQATGAGMMGQGMMGQGMGALHGEDGRMGMATTGMGSGMMGSAGIIGPMGIMQRGRPDADALLGAAGSLGLTSVQQDRLTAIAETERQDRQERIGAAMAAYARAGEILQADAPDVKAYERALQEASDDMVQVQVASVRAGQEATRVLTPEQRTRLQDSMALVGSMLCGEIDGAAGTAPGSGGPTWSR